MSKRAGAAELDENPPRPLGQRRENYLRKQVYYFYPFLRNYYEFLRQMGSNEREFQTSSLQEVKGLISYYSRAFAFGEFNIDQEQGLIDRMFSVTDQKIPREELHRQLLGVWDSDTMKTDGYIEDYFFGSVPCRDFSSLRVPGSPYSLAMTGGIMARPLNKNDLLFPLADYIAKHREGMPVSIWGNITRGSIEAAAIQAVIERAGVPCSFHLFRASTHAFFDKNPISIGEPEKHPSWAIAVDTFSAGGDSVPMAVKFLDSLGANRTSVHLTYGGEFWDRKMPIEFRSPAWRASKLGILFQAAFN